MNASLLDEIKKLSISERILLVEEIWDGLVGTADDSFSLSASQCNELDRRLDTYREQPDSGRAWNDIVEDYRRGNR